MAGVSSWDDERRGSPRFHCGGRVYLHCIPSQGTVVPGRILDLSLSGCRVSAPLELECGGRAELVIRVNSNSFRALGEVRRTQGVLDTGLEFVRLSGGGRGLLSDLIRDLSRIQTTMRRLREEAGMAGPDFTRTLERARLDALSRPGLLVPGAGQPVQSSVAAEDRGCIVGQEQERLVITIDVIG